MRAICSGPAAIMRGSSALLLAALVACAGARADSEIVRQSIEVQGEARSYYVYAPESAARPAPLVVLLHGSGQDGRFMARRWKDLADRSGFLVAAPDALDSKE